MCGSNPLLSILDLSGMRIGDKGLANLINGMKVYGSIISLNIGDNNLSHEGIEHLGEYMMNQQLIELWLSGNDKIGNKGIKTLSKCF